MNSTIVKIIIGLIIVGGGYYAFNASSSGTLSKETKMSDVMNAPLVKNEECAFTLTSTYGTVSATSYTSKDMMARIDVKASVAGQTIESKTIVRDNVAYNWMPAFNKGTKATISSDNFAREANGEVALAEMQKQDPNAKVERVCKDWTPVASFFAVPTSVPFEDQTDALNKMMKDLPKK